MYLRTAVDELRVSMGVVLATVAFEEVLAADLGLLDLGSELGTLLPAFK